MKQGERRRRGVATLVTTLLLAVVSAVPFAPGASAQEAVLFSQADFEAFATGTVIHVDALQSGDTRVEDTEIAFSSAAADRPALTPQRLNEMQRKIHPDLPDKFTYARGSGVEVGVVRSPVEDDNQIILAGQAEASAPPTSEDQQEIGPVPADPIVWANVARGQAAARWNDDGSCVLGEDLSRGLGYVEDAQLIDAGGDESEEGMDQPVLSTDAEDPARAVSQSRSRTTLVRQTVLQDQDGDPETPPTPLIAGDDFGLMSEVRETIAPITLFQNQVGAEITLEFLGEWVLQAVASGIPGGAYIQYGPGEASPSTPILRIIRLVEDEAGQPTREVTDVLEFQDVFGEDGLVVEIPGLIEIAIGEDPRAIGGNAESEPEVAADGTHASAAVDVVRLKLLERIDEETGDITQRAADLRVGHMEVSTRVPAGGLACEIPVTKVAVPDNVQVGDSFTTTITVNNPFNCDLVGVRVEDAITTDRGARFEVTGTSPQAQSVPSGSRLSEGTVVWNDIGPIPAGESRDVSVTLIAQGGSGRIIDIATATATLANCEGEGASVAGVAIGVAGAGVSGVSNRVIVGVGAVAPQQLARTGVPLAGSVLAGMFLLGLAATGRAVVRRRH